jgi:hypothetical protein
MSAVNGSPSLLAAAKMFNIKTDPLSIILGGLGL